jgi:hypothetical protein
MSLDIADLIGRMVVPAAVLGVLGLLRKYLPARKRSPRAQSDPNRVPEEFRGTPWVVGISMPLVGLVFALLAHKALVTANQYFAEADGPVEFRLLPSSAIWWFFPGFAAVCLSWEITRLLWSLFDDRDRIARYVDWSNERAGFDATRAFRWMALLIAMPIGVATLLAIPLHSTLNDTDIVVGHYARLKRQVLPYSRARRLVLVDGFRDRSGKFTPRAGMIVDFTDGSRWSSSDNSDFKSEIDPDLIAFFQRKTGLPLEHVDTQADIDKRPRRR